MEALLNKVTKELENISDKGLTSSNLETAYKLIDIYKDIKEAKYYDCMIDKDEDSYGARDRDSRGRYRGDDWNNHYSRRDSEYGRYYPINDRYDRYITRMREGLYNYNEGKERYRDGESKERMIDGVEMAMGALVNFVEYMMDNVETSQEKEVVRKYIDKLKKI